MIVYGMHAVGEALRAGRVARLHVARRRDRRLERLLVEARRRGVPVQSLEAAGIEHLARGGVHQGVAATLHAAPAWTLEDVVDSGGRSLVVVLDGIEDPHNVGAILRSADAAGASGIVRQTRRAAPLGGATAKAAAGAAAHVRVADVVNVARALDALKVLGVWVVGLDADAATPYDAVDLTLPTALVVGSEGRGMRRLVRERCDRLVSIPMAGHVGSLNVSVAAALVLFEAGRQRRAAGGAEGRAR